LESQLEFDRLEVGIQVGDLEFLIYYLLRIIFAPEMGAEDGIKKPLEFEGVVNSNYKTYY
jgi:hypothetical protein